MCIVAVSLVAVVSLIEADSSVGMIVIVAGLHKQRRQRRKNCTASMVSRAEFTPVRTSCVMQSRGRQPDMSQTKPWKSRVERR